MKDISILIGGQSGDGIESVAPIIAKIFNQFGYYIYIYRDYPSLIRGGHTFSIIRASDKKIGTHRSTVDVVLALNQACISKHRSKITKDTLIIYDKDQVKTKGNGLPLTTITKELGAPNVARNIGLVGAMCKALSINWEKAERVMILNIPKKVDLNLKIAKRAYDLAKNWLKIISIKRRPLPIFTGNEAVSLGLVKGGLNTYIAYPMTPATSVLHFLAAEADNFGLKVIHPENEISVMIMALGSVYAGERVAVGTSGGGFCLMTEGYSFSGMAELPVIIVMSQRPGPATGIPTYTAQGDLQFILGAGHGDFPRFVIAPSDAEESYYWSAVSLNLAWKYQISPIILIDKTLSEGAYSFDLKAIKKIREEKPLMWNGKGEYKRYLNTKNGVSSLAFPSNKKAVVKINSYEHDESGISTEDSKIAISMQDKRLRKEKFLIKDLEKLEAVKVYGNKKAKEAIVCWGANIGAAKEVAESLDVKAIQLIVLSPFSGKQFQKALKGIKKLINVENNTTGQLGKVLKYHGISVFKNILKYDGRPFSKEELEVKVKNALKRK